MNIKIKKSTKIYKAKVGKYINKLKSIKYIKYKHPCGGVHVY